ncbi:MAG: DUF4345 family protein [Pseudomonadota bacterium]
MTIALRIVLGLIGLAVLALGLNTGLGGIQTLGWRGPTDFVSSLNEIDYAVQDNNIRFFAGFFFAGGLVFLAGAVRLEQMAVPLITICCMIAVGGFFRLSGEQAGVALSNGAMASVVLEFTLFPLIAFFVYRSTR